jgi:hypothetical protein
MTSLWGFLWGTPWGSGTEWGARADPRDDASELLTLQPGDLDTIDTALARIRFQFTQTASHPAFARVIGGAFADLERAMVALERQRYVATASGVWLAEIGALVGLAREGWTDDEDYRLAVVAEALSLITSSTIDEIVDVALRLLPEGATMAYRDRYPAAWEIAVPDLPAARWGLMLAVLADMPAAGVGAYLTTWPEAETAGWAYDATEPDVVGSWGYIAGDDTDVEDVLSLWSYTAQIGS